MSREVITAAQREAMQQDLAQRFANAEADRAALVSKMARKRTENRIRRDAWRALNGIPADVEVVGR